MYIISSRKSKYSSALFSDIGKRQTIRLLGVCDKITPIKYKCMVEAEE